MMRLAEQSGVPIWYSSRVLMCLYFDWLRNAGDQLQRRPPFSGVWTSPANAIFPAHVPRVYQAMSLIASIAQRANLGVGEWDCTLGLHAENALARIRMGYSARLD